MQSGKDTPLHLHHSICRLRQGPIQSWQMVARNCQSQPTHTTHTTHQQQPQRCSNVHTQTLWPTPFDSMTVPDFLQTKRLLSASTKARTLNLRL